MPTNVKMPTTVGILTFMSKINFLLIRVEHGFFFITSGLDSVPKIIFEKVNFEISQQQKHE